MIFEFSQLKSFRNTIYITDRNYFIPVSLICISNMKKLSLILIYQIAKSSFFFCFINPKTKNAIFNKFSIQKNIKYKNKLSFCIIDEAKYVVVENK